VSFKKLKMLHYILEVLSLTFNASMYLAFSRLLASSGDVLPTFAKATAAVSFAAVEQRLLAMVLSNGTCCTLEVGW
jgi:hypothetical protein